MIIFRICFSFFFKVFRKYSDFVNSDIAAERFHQHLSETINSKNEFECEKIRFMLALFGSFFNYQQGSVIC